MKKSTRFLSALLAALLLLLLLPIPVSAEDGDDPGYVVFGNSYLLSSGDTLTGDLVVIGGSATVEQGAVVKGDLLVAGGTANISGTIRGDITAFGGIVNILEGAMITGNVVRYGGVFNLDEDATINGNIVSTEGSDFTFSPQPIPSVQPESINQLFEGPTYLAKQLMKFMFKGVQIIGLAMIGVVLSLFLDKSIVRMEKTFRKNFGLTLGIGLLTVFVFPMLMVIMMITILLIPVSLLGLVAFVLLTLYGWFAISLFLGNTIAQMFKTKWAVPLSVGVGALALSLLSFLIGSVPCIGWVFPFLAASAGLGAVILSRAGTRVYTTENSNAQPKPAAAIPASAAAAVVKEETGDISVEEAMAPLDLDAIPPLDDEGEENLSSEGEQ